MKKIHLIWLLIGGAWFFALFVGPTATPPSHILEAAFAEAPSEASMQTVNTVVQFRLPVAFQAFFAGGLLAVAGAILQTMLQNPLAEPFVLGVSSAGALGIVIAAAAGAAGFLARTLASFAFGSAAMLFIIAIPSLTKNGITMNGVILTGIVLNAVLSAMTLLLQSLLDPFAFRHSIGLLMGRISLQSWGTILPPLLLSIPFLAYAMRKHPELDMLSIDQEHAATSGIAVQKEQTLMILTSALLTVITVSLCGIIGFVGLVGPHAVRFLAGHRHRQLLPYSFLAGGSFLLIAHTISTSLIHMTEIPLGAVTALIGGPIFLCILIRYGRKHD